MKSQIYYTYSLYKQAINYVIATQILIGIINTHCIFKNKVKNKRYKNYNMIPPKRRRTTIKSIHDWFWRESNITSHAFESFWREAVNLKAYHFQLFITTRKRNEKNQYLCFIDRKFQYIKKICWNLNDSRKILTGLICLPVRHFVWPTFQKFRSDTTLAPDPIMFNESWSIQVWLIEYGPLNDRRNSFFFRF